MLWCAVWTWQVFETPSNDQNITIKEREYIINSIGTIQRGQKVILKSYLARKKLKITIKLYDSF